MTKTSHQWGHVKWPCERCEEFNSLLSRQSKLVDLVRRLRSLITVPIGDHCLNPGPCDYHGTLNEADKLLSEMEGK